MQASKPQTFLGVQALRGIAACMVVVHHTTQIWGTDFANGKLTVWNTGAAGVDIFFVISGFVMTVSSTGRKAPTAAKFMLRRIIRLVPLYWLVTLLTSVKLILVALHPSLGSGEHAHTSVGYVVESLLFIPVRNASREIIPILSPGWTLDFEMFFYILFAAALAFKVRPVRFLTPVLVALAIAGLFRTEGWPAFTILAHPMLLEFLAGVLLGYAVQGRLRVEPAAAAALGVLGFVAILVNPFPPTYAYEIRRAVEWGIPAFLIVQAAVMLESKYSDYLPKWALWIGDASYSLYLIHMIVVAVVARLFLKAHLYTHGHREAYLIGWGLIASILASLLMYRLVEKPMTGVLGRWTSGAKPAAGVRGGTAVSV
jgi:exopolysaccharide production protein ExoZ